MQHYKFCSRKPLLCPVLWTYRGLMANMCQWPRYIYSTGVSPVRCKPLRECCVTTNLTQMSNNGLNNQTIFRQEYGFKKVVCMLSVTRSRTKLVKVLYVMANYPIFTCFVLIVCSCIIIQISVDIARMYLHLKWKIKIPGFLCIKMLDSIAI